MNLFIYYFDIMFEDMPSFFLFMVKKAHMVKIGTEQTVISVPKLD